MKVDYVVLLVFFAVAATCGQQTASGAITPFTGSAADLLNHDVVLTQNGLAVSAGNGGEFQVDVYSPGTWTNGTTGISAYSGAGSSPSGYIGTFWTFCGSITEKFVPGAAYKVSSFETMTANAGSNIGQPNTNYMSAAGQALFAAYASGGQSFRSGSYTVKVPGHDALSSAVITGPNDINGLTAQQIAQATQDYIWQSLGFSDATIKGEDGAYPNDLSDAISKLGWGYFSTVTNDQSPALRSMFMQEPGNPTYNYGYTQIAQPQLFYTASSGAGNSTPEPATLVVWSLLGAASWLGMKVWGGGRRIGRRSWSPENRQAILDVIGRNQSH